MEKSFLIFFPRYIKKNIGKAVPSEYPITAPIPPQVAADAGPNKTHAPKAEAVKLVVKENDSVKAGDTLFFDKNSEKVKFVSPVSGKIK